MTSKAILSAMLLMIGAAAPVAAQNAPCEFDSKLLQFKGTPTQQARCLLRANGIGGVLGEELKALPAPLEKLVGKKVHLRATSLAEFLRRNSIDEAAIGGAVNKPLTEVQSPAGKRIPALYFVIHDTSSPYLGVNEFPNGFDTDPNWRGNDLTIWTNQPVAHVFVNRLGDSMVTTPFDEPVRKGFGTKFARDILKAEAKGLQLHIELVQPRRADTSDPNPKNDRIAPTPGFTAAQYERLALLYLAASVRRGTWLIPGYHSAYDAGIKDAHDDPQNFDLKVFADALKRLIGRIK